MFQKIKAMFPEFCIYALSLLIGTVVCVIFLGMSGGKWSSLPKIYGLLFFAYMIPAVYKIYASKYLYIKKTFLFITWSDFIVGLIAILSMTSLSLIIKLFPYVLDINYLLFVFFVYFVVLVLSTSLTLFWHQLRKRKIINF